MVFGLSRCLMSSLAMTLLAAAACGSLLPHRSIPPITSDLLDNGLGLVQDGGRVICVARLLERLDVRRDNEKSLAREFKGDDDDNSLIFA